MEPTSKKRLVAIAAAAVLAVAAVGSSTAIASAQIYTTQPLITTTSTIPAGIKIVGPAAADCKPYVEKAFAHMAKSNNTKPCQQSRRIWEAV